MSQVAVVTHKDDWVLLQKQCKAFIASGFLPDHITKGCSADQAMAKAITIAIKGRELGVPPMQAFASITVIRGKPCLASELMLALIYQRIPGAKISFVTPTEKQGTECTVKMQRPGGAENEFRFTLEDAKKAGLVVPNSAWTKYPTAMLRARAISAGARAVFPDAIMGCYTPEEMGGPFIDAEFENEVLEAGVEPTVTTKPPEKTVQETKAAPPAQQPPAKPATDVKKPANSQADWPAGSYGDPNSPVSEPQIAKLWALAKEAGYKEKHQVYALCGTDSLHSLKKWQVQDIFIALQQEIQSGKQT